MKHIKQNVHHYTAVFELNEHNSYTVTVPVLPGLVTEGRSFEKARTMAEDAIRCYLVGLKKSKQRIPYEKEIAQLRLAVTV